MASVRTQKEIRQRAPLWLISLLVLNFIVMAVDARDADGQQKIIRVWTQTLASPLQNASSKASGATSGFFQQIWNFRGAAQENEQLKQRVSALEAELNNARRAESENERLKALLHLNEQTQVKSVPARVIARDPSVWFNTITINVGSTSGVAVNMPVVTGGGIVGRVISVSPFAAQVMLITDEKAGAGAVVGQLGESGALGSVRGRADLGVGLIEMRYVSGLEKVQVNDTVMTTGQDGIYPPGLNVGRVVEVKNGTATQAHQILIQPGAQLDHLEEVAVLLYRAPQRSAPQETLPNVEKPGKQ
ncbi:MAG TPA: rod shape-determining protein MreC [Pyrinomonadaceae bacterium]|jgi:rod shape-determining protein MreC|nr:rod shape-determining protein MreC [Pyrinomonadaceae bacterium]